MNRKELTNTVMMNSNWKKHSGFYKKIQRFKGLTSIFTIYLSHSKQKRGMFTHLKLWVAVTGHNFKWLFDFFNALLGFVWLLSHCRLVLGMCYIPTSTSNCWYLCNLDARWKGGGNNPDCTGRQLHSCHQCLYLYFRHWSSSPDQLILTIRGQRFHSHSLYCRI